jgi:transcriptional regulator with XRE-family HTH domain
MSTACDKDADYGLNRRIKELRHTLKLSQVKFAAAIHISNGYQARIELEQCPVNERLIALITAAFDVNEHWLRSGEGGMFRKPAQLCTTPAERLERMGAVFSDLSPEFQDYILNQIDQLLVLQKPRRDEG